MGDLTDATADVCMQLSTLNLGICIVYWVDYGFSGDAGSFAWRVPVILQCIFLFPMFVLIAILPESSRWLAAHDRPDESLEVLRRIKAGQLDDETIVALHADIVKIAAEEAAMGSGSWKTLLQADKIHSRRRLLIACSVQAFQQLGGINAIICRLQRLSSAFLQVLISTQTTLALCSRTLDSITIYPPSCQVSSSCGSSSQALFLGS